MRMLIQTQLSNYDTRGMFILECDSGWQMVMGRVRVMLDLDPDLHVDVMGPMRRDELEEGDPGQVITDPSILNRDLFERYGDRLRYVSHWIAPNALATRYNFDIDDLAWKLDLAQHRSDPTRRYDVVYVNDPMHLRGLRALFHLKAGYTPRFVVHSHFIDDPDCPKFPTEASLWLGQCEAAIRADWNFWQCESAMKVFFNQMAKTYRQEVVKEVWGKSEPWDDGYSSGEIRSPYDASRVRFDVRALSRLAQEKVIVFVPNRIGGKGRSSDYTNCGGFMFDHLPKLANLRAAATGGLDYAVICGNPSQKIFNHELDEWCRDAGYVNLVPDALNRDEFKCVATHAHIAVGLYNQDSYGGTVARECVELGCLPFWLDNYEYSSIARKVGYEDWLTSSNLASVAHDLSRLVDLVRDPVLDAAKVAMQRRLRVEVRRRCSYENTTPIAYERMKRLVTA